jgi:hypothetical protein
MVGYHPRYYSRDKDAYYGRRHRGRELPIDNSSYYREDD